MAILAVAMKENGELRKSSDPDGDVLTAAATSEPGFGAVAATRGGRALQVTGVEDDRTGSTTFTYEASDGRAVDTATVTVTVHPWGQNEGPSQLRDPAIKLGANAQIDYNVLTDWIDPDGDQIYLVSATGSESLKVRMRFRAFWTSAATKGILTR